MKAAAHELKGLMSYYNCRIPFVSFLFFLLLLLHFSMTKIRCVTITRAIDGYY